MMLMDELEWRGDVEIHYKSSQWDEHKHNKDISYNQVILHVVWEHDIEIYTKENFVVPTLELKDYINENILNNYKKLFSKSKKWK